MSSLIVNRAGKSMPSPQILERLRQIDPALSLRFFEYPPPLESHWAIMWQWPLNDRRRQLIQEGKIGDDPYDVISRMPKDCNADEAFGHITRNFVRTTSDYTDRLLSKLDRFNKRAQADNVQEDNDLADELIEENAPTLFREQGKTSPRFRGGWLDLKNDN